MNEYEKYSSYDFDRLQEGSSIKIEHGIYCNGKDISDLTSKSLSEIQAMREDSLKAEQAAYENVRASAREWEKAAAVTHRLDLAIEYLRMPPVLHSSNKWDKDLYGNYDCISNKVYKMYCRIDDYKSWRADSTRWTVKWHIYTNSPNEKYNVRIAGQERSFNDKAAAEKYLQGRIKAYSHLFTEISPPIPDEYVSAFTVHGQLLPGYTTEKMKQQEQEKPSIRKQLNELKNTDKSKPMPERAKKRSEPAIE